MIRTSKRRRAATLSMVVVASVSLGGLLWAVSVPHTFMPDTTIESTKVNELRRTPASVLDISSSEVTTTW